MPEFVEGFLAEADEYLSSANVQLVAIDAALRQGQASPRPVRELFRALHTIKGLAAMVGVEPVVDIAHELESMLRDADAAGGRLEAEALELLVRGVRAIEERVRALANRQPVPAPPGELVQALAARHHGITGGRSAATLPADLPPALAGALDSSEREQLRQGMARGQRAIWTEFIPSPDRVARGVTITRVLEQLTGLGEMVKVLPRAAPETPGNLAFTLLLLTDADDERIAAVVETRAIAELPADADAPERSPLPEEDDEDGYDAQLHRYVRIDVDRLDDALEKLSSLVVSRFKLARAITALTERGMDTRDLRALFAEEGRQLRDLRTAIMQARMLSLADMLQRVPLLVRGLTRGTEKSVALRMRLDRAELDKSVAEQLFPALVHLVRNAVDHAIEPREERRRAGKPEEGCITIACDDVSGAHLTLTVADDGRGIDDERVARAAQRPVPTSPEQLLELLCQPGLSTREQVSRTSGRGMGMDIVKRTVQGLGGSLALHTAPGVGTRFTLRVPLSVTIVDAFAFSAGAQSFVTPVAMVEEIIDITATRMVQPPALRPGAVAAPLIERRGATIPLVGLHSLLQIRGPAPPASKALVVQRNGTAIAFAVSRLLGQYEVVVRPIDDPLVRVKGVSGAADLGDGRATLVLDLVALGELLLGDRLPDRRTVAGADPMTATRTREPQTTGAWSTGAGSTGA
jgi:two-component system chemotaxis sensor kinase CheA